MSDATVRDAEYMAKLGRIGKGKQKTRAKEHYQNIVGLAAEGRRKAAKADPGWNSARMAKAWATRRARGN